jgi:rubredoxin
LYQIHANSIIIQKNRMEDLVMKKYVCSVCGYVYDPEKGIPEEGIAPGTAFENLPDTFVCPVCGVGKEDFEPEA